MGNLILSMIDDILKKRNPEDVGYMLTVLGCIIDGDKEYAKQLISLYMLSQK